MKRFHVSLAVDDIEVSGSYYQSLFGRAPDIERDDYRQWLLDEPPLNISLNANRVERGVSHVGIQVDSEAEFAALKDSIEEKKLPSMAEDDAHCCYAHSDKRWLRDPDGVHWELFVTHKREEVPLDRCCGVEQSERGCA